MRLYLLVPLTMLLSLTLGICSLRAQERATFADAVLRPGDAVRITVWQEPELSGEFVISDDGLINHPLYRHVHVAGETIASARRKLETYLANLKAQPEFVLEPLLRVSLAGEIVGPRLYRLPSSTSIGEAISLAGGVTDRADLDSVRLLRDGEEFRVDLRNPNAGLAATRIRSGDHLFVPRKKNIVTDYLSPVSSMMGFGLMVYNAFFK